MPIECRAVGDNCSHVAVSGNFDFSLHREFRGTYRYQSGAGHLFRIDLAQTLYMDSSALGMLLLLREHAQSIKGRVVIEHVPPAIRRILDVAHFDKLFEIVE